MSVVYADVARTVIDYALRNPEFEYGASHLDEALGATLLAPFMSFEAVEDHALDEQPAEVAREAPSSIAAGRASAVRSAAAPGSPVCPAAGYCSRTSRESIRPAAAARGNEE
ncbi:hypothetical protein [Nocardia xishanensis]|uniref:Uncharacterized protein n=1 Tax=Nocardia xishanensis TaxID=238964 RepID=A0ABW7X3E4_9NOCA